MFVNVFFISHLLTRKMNGTSESLDKFHISMHYNTKLNISEGQMCFCTLCATFSVCFTYAKLLEDICVFFLWEHVLVNIYTLIQQIRIFFLEYVNILNTNTAGISNFSRCVNDISLFLDITQRVLVISYRRLGTTFLPHFQESSILRSCPLGLQVFKQSSRQASRNQKICLLWLLAPWKGFTGCLETSVTNYHQRFIISQKIGDLIAHELTWGLRIILFNNFTLFRATNCIYRSSGLITVWRYSKKHFSLLQRFHSKVSPRPVVKMMLKNHLDIIGRNEPIQRKAKFWQSYVRALKGQYLTFSPCKQCWEVIITSDFWLNGFNCTELKFYWRYFLTNPVVRTFHIQHCFFGGITSYTSSVLRIVTDALQFNDTFEKYSHYLEGLLSN